MIEIPVWAFVLMIIVFSGMYVAMLFSLSSDSTEKESNESLLRDLALERSKVRDLRDELEMMRYRYNNLENENLKVEARLRNMEDRYRKLLDEKIELSKKYKDLESLYYVLSDLYETLKSGVVYSGNPKGCQGCCMRPVHSVDKEEK